MANNDSITIEDYLAWEEVSYSWARALDTKDWDLLRSILAPKVTLDYLDCFGWIDQDIPSEQYVTKISSSDALGPLYTKTMHVFAASKVKKFSPVSATAWRQIMANNFRFDEKTKEIVGKGHGHGVLQFFYEKIGNDWKLTGLKAVNDFMEGDIQSVYPTYPKCELQL